jgi:chaperonin cofactor prefoldin
MSRIEEIAEELWHLNDALKHIDRAIDEYQSIDWPTGVYPPHHIEMEMEEVRHQIESRIEEIEDKLERI